MQLTVALRLIPTELTRIKNGLCANANSVQKTAVRRVVVASVWRRPSELSTMYAPSCLGCQFRGTWKEKYDVRAHRGTRPT